MSRFWDVFLFACIRFSPLVYVRIGYFSTFTLGFTVGSSRFHPSIVGRADPLGAEKSERPGHKFSNVSRGKREEARFK